MLGFISSWQVHQSYESTSQALVLHRHQLLPSCSHAVGREVQQRGYSFHSKYLTGVCGFCGLLNWYLEHSLIMMMVLMIIILKFLQAPEPQDLVMISQCKCTAGDIVRMEKIVESKLACLPNEEPVTTLTFLTLYHSLLTAASAAALARSPLSPPLQVPDLLILSNKLETICCDSNYAAFPSSQLALALVFTEVKRHNVLIELQQLLQVTIITSFNNFAAHGQGVRHKERQHSHCLIDLTFLFVYP